MCENLQVNTVLGPWLRPPNALSLLRPHPPFFFLAFFHDKMYWLQEGIQQPRFPLSQKGLQSLQACNVRALKQHT